MKWPQLSKWCILPRLQAQPGATHRSLVVDTTSPPLVNLRAVMEPVEHICTQTRHLYTEFQNLITTPQKYPLMSTKTARIWTLFSLLLNKSKIHKVTFKHQWRSANVLFMTCWNAHGEQRRVIFNNNLIASGACQWVVIAPGIWVHE